MKLRRRDGYKKSQKINSSNFALRGDINRLMVLSSEFSPKINEYTRAYTRNFMQFFGLGLLDRKFENYIGDTHVLIIRPGEN